MDTREFFHSLNQNINKLTSKRLFSQCLSTCEGKQCKITTPFGEQITGTLERTGSTSEISLKTNWRNTKIKFENIAFMACRHQTRTFKTDSDISSKKKSVRQLQEWSTEGPDIPLNTEDRNWDQFETNLKKFGVISTYDEELYTTKKVHESQLSKDQVNRAIKIEKELANKEQKENNEDEDEEKMFGAVIGTGRYEMKPEIVVAPMRERAISMASYGEFTKDEYKKTREYLMNPHRPKGDQISPQIGLLDALDLNIAQPANEEIIMNFVKFKQEKQPSRDTVLKGLKEFSSKMNSKANLEVVEEEKTYKAPVSVVDLFIDSWRSIQRDNGFQEW